MPYEPPILSHALQQKQKILILFYVGLISLSVLAPSSC